MSAIGPSPEMYLKSLFELSPADEPVSIAAVAGRLGVTPVSASEMIHRLERGRLVVHRRYRGVHLTSGGRRHAVGLIRRHRLWECFLHTELGLPWESVHDQACELEHAATDEVTEALAARMDHPGSCPHGNPIPDRQQQLQPQTTLPLTELETGDEGLWSRSTPRRRGPWLISPRTISAQVGRSWWSGSSRRTASTCFATRPEPSPWVLSWPVD